MTLTIELTPEKERALREEAARRGLPIADYVRTLVEGSLPARTDGTTGERLTPEEEERLLDELAQIGKDVPVHPGETYGRETIYCDHD